MDDTDGFNFFRLHTAENLQHKDGHRGIFIYIQILGDFWAKVIYRDLFE